MARGAWILPFISVAFRFLSSAPPQNLLVMPSGSNVSLTCNLSSSEYQTWFRLDSDRILPLFTVMPGKLPSQGGVIREDHQEHSTLGFKGDLEAGVTLEIRSVTEDDSGAYICSSKNRGTLRFNSAAHLTVMDPGDSPLPVQAESCWSPGLCLIPAVFSATLLCATVCFCFCKGHFWSCCCSKVTEDVPVHYSSLKHLPKPRPFDPAHGRLVQDDVVYSAVKHHVQATQCQMPSRA